MLELLSVANIATKFGAIELSMSLELSKSLPDDLTLSVFIAAAFMRELTEVNTVLENLVDFLEEVSPSLAVRAAHIIVWGHS